MRGGGGGIPRMKPHPVSIHWDTIGDEALLKIRICDLPIRLQGTELEERIRTVYKELDQQGISFHPLCYLADEWFSPEGDPVIGIPFYLAHPRLTRLERTMMLEAEGESRTEFFKLLRHEVGHALSHAYRLHRYRGYGRFFGPSSKSYPEVYHPRPYSRRYVRHLENWYAQSHPDEDFAETFAVWLTPGSNWRAQYKGWGALEKLEFVDRVMAKVKQKMPLKRTGEKMSRLSRLRIPLETYYRRKRKTWQEDFPDFFDQDLGGIFSSDAAATGETAVSFLSRHRAMLVRGISRWTGEKRFTIKDLLSRFAKRCQELGLRVQHPEPVTLMQVSSCLTAMATRYFLTGKFKRPV